MERVEILKEPEGMNWAKPMEFPAIWNPPPARTGDSTMKQNSSQSLTTQAYNTLKERIMRWELRPGELLLVQPLAKELGISRTPVREAMVRLQQEGFVEEAEGKKFRVAQVKLKSILEIHEIRELIELHAVSRAADSRTDGQRRELDRLAARMEKAVRDGDHVAFFEADMAFHARIIHMSGNATLEALMVQLNEKIQRIRHMTTYVTRRVEDTIGEHKAILDAVREGDPEAARQAMKYHLDKVREGVVQLFENGAMRFFGGIG
jgi:DNA-binding GntR family transcriptional regulator